MDAISEAELNEIERRIVAGMVETFGVDLSGLVLDMTNFATWIDSANDRAPIAQRGHSKQKRADLRIVGLGLVVSTDGGIPLVSHAYPGNRPDVTQFPAMVEELGPPFRGPGRRTGRAHPGLRRRPELGGQLRAVRGPHRCISSARSRPLTTPTCSPCRKAATGPSTRSASPASAPSRPPRSCFGAERRVVVTHSETLHDKQSAGFDQTLAKARRQLSELQARLARGKTRKAKDKVEAEIAEILKPRWVSRVVSATLAGEEPAELRLALPHRAKGPGRASKTRSSASGSCSPTKAPSWPRPPRWSADYRSQEAVEGDFRQMKDPKVVSFSPMFHWTDQKIRVHVFYCVLALTVARLMVREADRAGLAPERAGTARHPGRDPRDRAALPRRTGPAPSPADAHRDGPHPATPLRPVRPRRLRPGQAMTASAPPSAWDALESRPARNATRSTSATTAGDGSSAPTPSAGKTAGPCCSATRPAARPAPAPCPPTPANAGVACSWTRSTTCSSTRPPHGATADNYNPAHPFPAIDEVSLAVSAADRQAQLGNTRRLAEYAY